MLRGRNACDADASRKRSPEGARNHFDGVEMRDALKATYDLLKAFVGPDDALGQSVLGIAFDALSKAESSS
jgi:hypothetical protein